MEGAVIGDLVSIGQGEAGAFLGELVEGEEEAGGFVELVEVFFDLRALLIDLEIEAGDLHGPNAFEGEVGVDESADEAGLGGAGGLVFRREVGDEGVELGAVLVVLDEPIGGAESVGDGIPGGVGLALEGDGAVRFLTVLAGSLFLFFGCRGVIMIRAQLARDRQGGSIGGQLPRQRIGKQRGGDPARKVCAVRTRI